MNFKDIKNFEKYLIVTESKNSINFQKEIISDYLEKEKKKANAFQNPFIYFYEDVVSSTLDFDFKSAIDENYYENATEDALACLEICLDFSNLPLYSINGWLQNALKYTDNFVLHYIQDVLKEIPLKLTNSGEEKSRYIHLKRMKGEISTIGEQLIYLYEIRSKHLEHRTKIYPDGKQELLRPPRKEIRRVIVKSYPVILKLFLKLYKSKYSVM